jgi:hypothetical protein
MNKRIRNRKEDAQELKVNDKLSILPDELVHIHEKTFAEFKIGYEQYNEYTEDERRMIYLKGYLNYSFADIGKTMAISKEKARLLGKALENEVKNVRIERGVEIRRQCGATKEDFEKTLSIFAGEAQKVLLEKAFSNNELSNMSVDKLVSLITTISDRLKLNGETFTGQKKLPASMNITVESTVSEEF